MYLNLFQLFLELPNGKWNAIIHHDSSSFFFLPLVQLPFIDKLPRNVKSLTLFLGYCFRITWSWDYLFVYFVYFVYFWMRMSRMYDEIDRQNMVFHLWNRLNLIFWSIQISDMCTTMVAFIWFLSPCCHTRFISYWLMLWWIHHHLIIIYNKWKT